MTVQTLGLAERAETALTAGEWSTALGLLREAQAVAPLAPDELGLLARAAYGAGELEAAITAWEELCAEYTRRGDTSGAAAAAATVAMYLMMDTGLMAPVRGWLARADRLLGDGGESPTHALIAMCRTYERLLCGDLDACRSWAQRAVECGDRQGVAVASALGRVAAARLVILDGDVDRGLDLLDEAAVSVVSGELDPLATGMVYCELVCAMQGLAQYDRAEQWTEAMEQWRAGTAYGGINGRCRVHRAEIFRLRGACAEAVAEATEACRELRPWMRREFGWPLTELGLIRLRTGDLGGAEEAFAQAHEHGWNPQPGLALLRLAQGEVATAAALVADALEHPCPVPSKERPPAGALRRAPLLAAQAEIAAAAGDAATARSAAEQLTDVAATFRSRALIAEAALARGRARLTAGDPEAAATEAETAVTEWQEVGAPYEVAQARLVLARAHRGAGRAERADLEETAAHAALERIGAARASAGGAPRAPAVQGSENGVFSLDGDTRRIVFAGRSVLLHDLKGMRYLACLLSAPDREFHVLDLVGEETGDDPRAAGAGHSAPLLDDQARSAYRRRLAEIDEDVEEARALGDVGRVALARADRDFLVRELAAAFGLGGRDRIDGSTSERARASVTRALRYALDRIAEHHPELADHLRRTVRTGTFCVYAPDPLSSIRWRI